MLFVKDTCTISELTRNAAPLVRLAEKQGAVTVCRNGRNVAFLVSRDRMEAIVETLEIMANPKAMQAIRDYESGKVKMLPVSVLDED